MKNILKAIIRKLKHWFRLTKLQFIKNRNYSMQRVFRTIGKFILYVLAFMIPAYGSIKPEDKSVPFNDLVTLFIGAIIYVTLNYLLNNWGDSKNKDKITSEEVTFKCISGAIELLTQAERYDAAHHKQYVEKALRYIESVVQILVKQLRYPEGTICANLMVKKEGCHLLELKYFGTFLDGRDNKKTLTINFEKPDPGAPEAFVSKRAIYINNVHAPELNGYFKSPTHYHSIISVPIIGGNNNVLGILNIDSTIKDQFGSDDVIEKIIIPKIKPFIKLIKLEKQLSATRSVEL